MNETRLRILEAAEELLSQKGAAKTTIAEIARKANVVDSHAYQYFKSKKGLVFSVAQKRMTASLILLKEQLEGILDPKSQLSKFIWYGLNYNDNHQDYVRNLVFDYRANPEFYTTPAYALIREHASICKKILERGVLNGDFSNTVDLSLIRDIIYGTLDTEAITCVLTGEIDKSVNDWENILSILLSMIDNEAIPQNLSDKRLRIIETAESVFSQFGFNNAKISEIAKQAGVAEGSIYDYFKNKEDLLLSISKFRLEQLNITLKESFHIKTPVEKLRRFMRLHFSIFTKNRNYLRVFVLDTLLNRNFYNSDAYDNYKNYKDSFIEIIEDGKKQGVFRKDLNSRVFKNMFFGTFLHLSLRWIIFSDGPFDKMYEIDTVLDLFTKAALTPDSVPVS